MISWLPGELLYLNYLHTGYIRHIPRIVSLEYGKVHAVLHGVPMLRYLYAFSRQVVAPVKCCVIMEHVTYTQIYYRRCSSQITICTRGLWRRLNDFSTCNWSGALDMSPEETCFRVKAYLHRMSPPTFLLNECTYHYR